MKTERRRLRWPSELRNPLPGSLLLFAYALLFAIVEIELEGKAGWAMNLPTWHRRSLNAVWASFVIAALPWLVHANQKHLVHHAVYVATMLVLIIPTAWAAPLYRRGYERVGRPKAFAPPHPPLHGVSEPRTAAQQVPAHGPRLTGFSFIPA